jgi:hypothetical protein
MYSNCVRSNRGYAMKKMNENNSAKLGLAPQSMGKTQARKEFFPLVDSLSEASAVITITDHDQPVAVILSYQDYVVIAAKACNAIGIPKSAAPNLIGSVEIVSDLDEASEKISQLFEVSFKESAGNL